MASAKMSMNVTGTTNVTLTTVFVITTLVHTLVHVQLATRLPMVLKKATNVKILMSVRDQTCVMPTLVVRTT